MTRLRQDLQDKRRFVIPGVLTLRDNTERPETVEAGSNVLAGTEAMIRCARSMLERGNRWKNPFGDGGRGGEDCEGKRVRNDKIKGFA